MENETAYYSRKEERANYLTHGFGFVLSLLGLAMLVEKGWSHQDPYVLPGVMIFGVGLMCCFLSSTVYHWVQEPNLKRRLRLIDHLCIYLLIGASYTPFALVNLRGNWGIPVFFMIWGLAILGSVFKIAIRRRLQSYQKVDALIYVLMGCFALLFIEPVMTHIPSEGLYLLMFGGAAYIIGVLFYLSKTIPYNHAIWHLFVLTGGAAHFAAVWVCVDSVTVL